MMTGLHRCLRGRELLQTMMKVKGVLDVTLRDNDFGVVGKPSLHGL